MIHLVYFSNRNLSQEEYNYTTTKREGLDMIYALQNLFHYLLRGNFKLFTKHSYLNYLVNNPILLGWIYKWLLLFLDLSFEVIFEPQKHNHGPNHVSWIESGKVDRLVDDQLPNAVFFRIESIMDHLEDISLLASPYERFKMIIPQHRNIIWLLEHWNITWSWDNFINWELMGFCVNAY